MGIVKRITSKTNLKLAQIERELEFGNGTMRKWDQSSPSFDKVVAVANHINVSLDYLAGREQKADEIESIINLTYPNPKIQEIIKKLTTSDIPFEVISFINDALDKYVK